jgi:Domain of unknown function (DUF4345)
MNDKMTIKNLHLAISAFCVLIVGLAYGIFPDSILHVLFDFNFESHDFRHLLKGIMGLYIGISIYWLWGIIHAENWQAATQSNIVFMGGLACGRIISLISDGMPSMAYLLGLLIELLLMIWGMNNLHQQKPNTDFL